jgi:hypothetical protein
LRRQQRMGPRSRTRSRYIYEQNNLGHPRDCRCEMKARDYAAGYPRLEQSARPPLVRIRYTAFAYAQTNKRGTRPRNPTLNRRQSDDPLSGIPTACISSLPRSRVSGKPAPLALAGDRHGTIIYRFIQLNCAYSSTKYSPSGGCGVSSLLALLQPVRKHLQPSTLASPEGGRTWKTWEVQPLTWIVEVRGTDCAKTRSQRLRRRGLALARMSLLSFDVRFCWRKFHNIF